MKTTVRLSARHWLPIVLGAFLAGGAVALAAGVIIGAHRGSRTRADEARKTEATKRTPREDGPTRPGYSASASGARATWSTPQGAASTFARLERSLPGPIGVVVSPLGSRSEARFGPLQDGHAWSTMKVPVLVTYEHRLAEEGRMLGVADSEDATLAIEQSDNAAINAIFARLEELAHGLIPASEDIEQTLRDSGDPLTVVNTLPNDQGFSTFGQTEWSLSASTTFYKALANGCLLDHAQTAHILTLMGRVVSYERWGAGEAGFARALPIAFKGGWGPEPDGSYLVRQTAIIGADGHGYVLAMLAHPPGVGATSFADGEDMLTKTATWARQTFDPRTSHGPTICALH